MRRPHPVAPLYHLIPALVAAYGAPPYPSQEELAKRFNASRAHVGQLLQIARSQGYTLTGPVCAGCGKDHLPRKALPHPPDGNYYCTTCRRKRICPHCQERHRQGQADYVARDPDKWRRLSKQKMRQRRAMSD